MEKRFFILSRIFLVLTGFLLLAVSLAPYEEFWQFLARFQSENRISAEVMELASIIKIFIVITGALCLSTGAFLPFVSRTCGKLVLRWEVSTPRERILFVLGLAFLLRVGWNLVVYAEPFLDFKWYHDRALDISKGEGYAVFGEHTAYWPVGYPAFLGLIYLIFGDNHTAAIAANVLLSILTVFLTYILARDLAEERTATFAALIIALFPSQIYFTSVLCSENLFTPLFIGSLIMFDRYARNPSPSNIRLAAASGFLLGLAALTRSTVILFPVAMTAWLLLREVRFSKTLAAMVIACALMFGTILPWTARNYVRFNRLILVSDNAADNFFIGNWWGADGNWNIPPPFFAKYRLMREEGKAPPGLGWKFGWQGIREDPFRMPGLILKKWKILFLNGKVGAGFELGPGGRPSSKIVRSMLLYFAQIYQWIVLLAAASYLVLRRRDRRSPSILVSVIVLVYWALIHAIFFGHGRFLQPALPLIAILAAFLWRFLISQRQIQRSESSRFGRDQAQASFLR